MNDTSIEVYNKEVRGKETPMQLKVLGVIGRARRPVNNLEIANEMKLPINSVTPRVNELVKSGRLVQAFKAIYPKTGRRVTYWRIKDEH